MAVSSGIVNCILRAPIRIVDSKQADQPAANNCSGLVPLPLAPGLDNLMSRLPSELFETPSRPPAVCVLAVYNTLCICLNVSILILFLCLIIFLIHVFA